MGRDALLGYGSSVLHWLGQRSSPGSGLPVTAFLGIALVVWPMWLPLSLQALERNPVRRRTLMAMFWIGGAGAAYASFLMIRWRPVAHIAGHSIRYDYVGSGEAGRRLLYLLAYIVPTIVPFFVSTMKLARTMGAMLVVSLIVTVLVQRDALTSVWCFFAAILSGLLFVSVGREQQSISVSRAEQASAPAA
jgi:hypothetical protein